MSGESTRGTIQAPRSVQDTNNWRMLDQTISEARDKFSDLTPDALDDLIEEAVLAARRPSDP